MIGGQSREELGEKGSGDERHWKGFRVKQGPRGSIETKRLGFRSSGNTDHVVVGDLPEVGRCGQVAEREQGLEISLSRALARSTEPACDTTIQPSPLICFPSGREECSPHEYRYSSGPSSKQLVPGDCLADPKA